MKKDVNFNDFCNSFGESYKNHFTYEGKKALYNYLIEYEESTGTELELDPVAYCCEYTEYENLEELQKDYTNIKSLEELQDRTQFIPIYDIKGNEAKNFIIQQF